ncbi:MAG: NAD-binding protein, partial [Pseudomonadota bacterium]
VALDNDPDRFVAATADGYSVNYGDASNLRLVDAIGANDARAVVIGAPRYEVSRSITPMVERDFPGMDRFVSLDTLDDVAKFKALGMRAYLSMSEPKGIEMATDLLRALGVDDTTVADWLRQESERFNTDDLAETLVDPVDQAA